MCKGNLFVISGPSGVGKGTLVARLVDALPNVWVSVSATTRNPRPGEVDGESYFFLSRERFQELIENDGFLEWAEYAGNFYGTPRASVKERLENGYHVILEIEYQGAFQVRNNMPETHLVFIEPPSLDELEQRLRGRGTEGDDVVSARMETALVELSHKEEYDKQLVNDDLDRAVDELVAYISACSENR